MPPKPSQLPQIPKKVLETAIEACKNLVASWTPRRIANLLQPPAENAAGSRFLPPVDAERDRKWGIRLDKAEPKIIDNKHYLPINMQVNRDAKDPALKGIDTHAKLAKFDHDLTKPADIQSVYDILNGLKEAHYADDSGSESEEEEPSESEGGKGKGKAKGGEKGKKKAKKEGGSGEGKGKGKGKA